HLRWLVKPVFVQQRDHLVLNYVFIPLLFVAGWMTKITVAYLETRSRAQLLFISYFVIQVTQSINNRIHQVFVNSQIFNMFFKFVIKVVHHINKYKPTPQGIIYRRQRSVGCIHGSDEIKIFWNIKFRLIFIPVIWQLNGKLFTSFILLNEH